MAVRPDTELSLPGLTSWPMSDFRIGVPTRLGVRSVSIETADRYSLPRRRLGKDSGREPILYLRYTKLPRKSSSTSANQKTGWLTKRRSSTSSHPTEGLTSFKT